MNTTTFNREHEAEYASVSDKATRASGTCIIQCQGLRILLEYAVHSLGASKTDA